MGAFELAYQSPSDPVWSGTFGPPIMHHYILGAILVYIGYILITFDKEIREMVKDVFRRKVRRKRERISLQFLSYLGGSNGWKEC